MSELSLITNDPIRTDFVDEKMLDGKILECIEIGLDSFGMNLDELVKSEIERSGGLKWENVPRHPEKLEARAQPVVWGGGFLYDREHDRGKHPIEIRIALGQV